MRRVADNLVLMAVALAAALTAGAAQGGDVITPFEASGGLRTPRYDETVAWCRDLAAGSDLLFFGSFGVSPEGRPLPVVVADRRGRFTPEEHAERDGHVVLLLQAAIHAGEPCGKDAGMLLLRDLAADADLAARLLEHVTLVFIPIFNVDGHERFSAWNRINQNGPEQMGWRTTARNQNLNRDYLKADTPEMRAWLRLFTAWLPDFFIDTHATDGADYQYAVTYAVETQGNLDAGLTDWTRAYERAVNERMAADGWPMIPYVSFRSWHDPTSGLQDWAAGPRFSQGYAAVQNRPGLLVETHMLKDYATRVEGTDRLVRHTLEWLNGHAAELRRLTLAADRRAASAAFRAEPLPLSFAASDSFRTVDFLGVGYDMHTSAITGGAYPVFDGGPVTLQLPFYDDLRPVAAARLPEAYLVPPQWTEAVERLEAHGLRLRRLTAPAEIRVRSWRLTDPEWRQASYEGHHPLTYRMEELTETRAYPAGTVVVDMNQRGARVAAHLLDPAGPDALVRWDYFDPIFERVEYVESYVIERMIPEMLAADPDLAAELEARKAADPEFAGDPWAIRYWFYARTPYFDTNVGIYPVGAVDDRSAVDGLR
jgi:hypothetical protein